MFQGGYSVWEQVHKNGQTISCHLWILDFQEEAEVL